MGVAGRIDTQDFFSDTRRAVGRRTGNRPRQRSYLIVCEGAQTEPNYFQSIKELLPNEMIGKIEIVGAGANTLTLLKVAEDEIERRKSEAKPDYYHVWIVFDRDSFVAANFDNTINSVENRNRSQSDVHWHAAWSNEAFELWYLYHFQPINGGGLSRSVFQQRLDGYLKKPPYRLASGYRKNSKEMFALLRDRLPFAIKNAEAAFKKWNTSVPFSQRNPATSVYQLVSDLMRYL